MSELPEDELLSALNALATGYLSYEYGLPLIPEEPVMEQMRDAVRAFARQVEAQERERCLRLVTSVQKTLKREVPGAEEWLNPLVDAIVDASDLHAPKS